MKFRFIVCFLTLVLGLSTQEAQAQNWFDNVIQIDGVTMTADSLRAVAGVEVVVKSKNRGVESGPAGVFTIVCYKGDTLQFSALGFRSKEYVVQKDIKGQYFSLIQLMVQDTFYLPETIIRPLPDKDHFAYAFRYWRIPDDQYEIARHNTDKYTLRALAYTLPHDGREAQAMYQHDQANKAVYYGQQQPMNILNPLAWADFFEAWKRGDFRNQNQQPSSGGY
ncbi:MAG: carboxypeptidase-like regulatory domain-containing protein [Flavipsychrobacter sp.]|nr:carboxypeptidase-like regulatory domain-containing protein [Flavipsychrobacter sp.]